MRKYAVPLMVANAVALLVIGASYLLYSRLLGARDFGIYSVALTLGGLATLALDGGVKTSVIKHRVAPTTDELGALLHVMLGFSVLLLILTACSRILILRFYPVVSGDVDFVVLFVCAYLVTYPWICLSTACLERRLEYSKLAWIESAGMVLERGLPAVFLSFTAMGLRSFVWSLLIGRLVRIVALASFERISIEKNKSTRYRDVLHYLREGAWYQLGASSSLVRDNLHVLLIGPAFGAIWVGFYAWGLQLCMLASQVFVQMSARITIPLAVQTSEFAARWKGVMRQLSWLTAATAPILSAGLLIAPSFNHRFFADKWSAAVSLLPLLFARMIPGVATAPVGAVVLVELGARSWAISSWIWTAAELGVGAAAIAELGVKGLAVSYSVMAWVGLALLILPLRGNTLLLLRNAAASIVSRPGLWMFAILAATLGLTGTMNAVWWIRANIGVVICIGGCFAAIAYVCDRGVLRVIRSAMSGVRL